MPRRSSACSAGCASGRRAADRLADWRLALGALACACVLALASACAPASGESAYPASDLEQLSSSDRVLVIAPHPDDETLCCGGLIERARAAGAQVAIVWLTSGDAFQLDAGMIERRLHPGAAGMRELGTRRMQEARAAATTLGVPAENQYFLGFPDRGLLPLLLDHFNVPYTSTFTQLDRVSYPGTLDPGSSYEGEQLLHQLERLLERLQPTYVLAPSPLDTHPDHRAAGDLAIRALGERHQLERIRYWIVHGGIGWPAPRGLHAGRTLTAPRRARAMLWQSVLLSEPQRRGKLAALGAYHTQMFGLERRYLESFVRSNELYALRPLPEALTATQLQAH
jgi:LmbE family N-acetylglucosaminyl deacetylase